MFLHETLQSDKIVFMAKKFPKGKLVKFCGTANIVWYATHINDARNVLPTKTNKETRLDIGIVTSDPYATKESILVAIASYRGQFTLSWTTASRLSTIEKAFGKS